VRRRILVVDDEPGVLRAVCRILQSSYEVLGVATAEEALARFVEFHPDLAILDIRMPGMDGFALMARLKTDRPDLDVILMTGSADESDEKLLRAIQERAFYFIQKPFDREVLRTLVERCLDQRRLEAENRLQFRRLETVLKEARAFQTGLLPAPSRRLGAIEIVTRYVSCDQLCGDFYDYFETEPGVVTFLVADVAGHGAPAAMLTGVVKSGFRSCGSEGSDPQAVAERIWSGIRTFGANRFVTMFCGRIDSREGRLDYVTAGHPAAIVWDGERPLELLESTGPLISPVWDEPRWACRSREFGPGHRLLAYTDGLSEAQGPTEFFGSERVVAGAERTRAGGEALLDAILVEVEAFAQGRRRDDDLTMMAVSHLR
jgi:sigma-B regulation protein RsbU (phosphoserine phosphatase)